MGRKRKNVTDVRIHDIADKGQSVGRDPQGRVVFVDGAVPGDLVDVGFVRKKKGVLIGKAIRYHEYSPDRTDPFCQHFDICGGCKWQHFQYEAQLEAKEKVVRDAIDRIAKVPYREFKPIAGCESDRFYRNKLEFTFSDKRWITQEEIDAGIPIENRNGLGFHRPGAFDKVVDVRKCHLQPDPSNDIRNFVRAYANEKELSFYDIREKKGFLRNLIVRTSETGEVMIIMAVGYPDEETLFALLDALHERFPQIKSLCYLINEKKNDSYQDLPIHVYKGQDFITEKLGDLQFRIGPKSFFQTNTRQAKKLYDIVREMAGLKGHETLLDLYSGIGSIGLYLADACKNVLGVEQIEPAVEDARKNQQLNGIKNAQFVAGDAKDVLNASFQSKYGRPDIVVTDPPRAGMHPDVIQTLLALRPERIVYVSCNPSTQARDIGLLASDYELVTVQPVDMFPHTHHIENVVLLTRKENGNGQPI